MKRILLLLSLGAILTCPSFAQDQDSTNAAPQGPPPGEGPPGGGLTPDERQELKSAHDAALQANPDLAAQEKQLREEMDALHKQIDAAMIKADPNVAPIIAKMQAAHHHHDGPDGGDGPPPPPSGN